MNKHPDLEQLLNELSYKELFDSYEPSTFALQFIQFIKLVNGEEGEENKSAEIHYHMIDQLQISRQNLFVAHRGSAKALDVNTLVLTPSGTVRMGDIEIEDTVIDRNGKPTKVTKISEEFTNQCYKFVLTDGSEFIANEDHLHIVQRRTQTKDKKNVWKEEVLTTKELLNKGVWYLREKTQKNPTGKEAKYFIPLVNNVVQFSEEKQCPLDPYTAGVILGDGAIDKSQGTSVITSHISDIDEIRSYIPYELGEVFRDKRHPNTAGFRIKNIGHLVLSTLGCNTTYTKHIPECLLFGTVEERVEVLQGLMDTDGTVTPDGGTSFTSSSETLARGVMHIVKSLGGHCRIRKHNNNYAGYWNLQIVLQDINPFKLKRKADKWKKNRKYKSGARVSFESITPVGNVISKCITVDSPTESYLIEDCVVTHNTTVMHEYLFLYLATYGRIPGFGQVDVAMYISDTIDNGVKSMRTNLEFRWNNSEFLKKYVPVARFTDVRWEFTNADGKKFCVRGFGASTGVRGFKEYGKRPTWCGFDDLMSDKNAESPTITKDIKHIIYKAARQALHPRKRMQVWTGTPFNKSDPLYEAAGSGAWNVQVYPICEKFPVSRKDFKGSWEDRFSYDFVKGEYDSLLQSGEIASFNQELMLRIMSDEDRLVDDSDIIWYSRDELLKNKSNFNFYVTTDFATSEKTTSDFSVLGVWAYSNNRDWMLVDGFCRRQLMDANIDKLFSMSAAYNPLEAGIEINGQQKGFIQWIKNEMIHRNIFFNLAKQGSQEGIRRTGSKLERFKLFVPTIKAKKLWLPEELKDTQLVQEIMEEFRYATNSGLKAKHDDAIDMVTMLQELDAMKPGKRLETEFVDSEDGHFAWINSGDDEEDYRSSVIF